MKPVFVSDQLGCLYQTGYRQLQKLPSPEREHINGDLSLAVSVSPCTASWLWPRANLNAAVLHMPFGDNKQWEGPTAELAMAIWSAARLLGNGEHVLVYCFYGRNRSGLVCALIIRELLGITGAQALALLHRARKGSVKGNPHFVKYLEGLEEP